MCGRRSWLSVLDAYDDKNITTNWELINGRFEFFRLL